MTEAFSKASEGKEILLYTIRGCGLTAKLMPLGATLVRLYVPDGTGQLADVVLGYDSTYLVEQPLCARLRDPGSGRTMEVYTDLPGVHLYSGNYLGIPGKDGVYYANRTGICLETQFYPDAIHHPQWPQPVCKAGIPMKSQTSFVFSASKQ